MIRKVAKILVFTAGGLLSAVVAILVFTFIFLQTAAGGRFVGRTVQGILKDNLGLEAKIGSIRVDFFRSTVTMQEVALSDGKNPPIGAVEAVTVEIAPLALLANRLIVREAVIERPRGHIVMKDGVVVNLPKFPGAATATPSPAPAKEGPPLKVEVRAAVVRQGRVQFEIPGRLDADVRGLELSARGHPGFYDVGLSVESSTVTLGAQEFRDLGVALRAVVSETGIDLKDLDLSLGKEGSVKASGSMRNFESPIFDAQASVDLRLEVMKRLGLGLPDAAGRVKVDAKAKGTVAALEAQGRLSVEKGRFEQFSLGDLETEFSYGKNHAAVRGLTVKNDGVDIGVDAEIDLADDFPVEGEVRIARLDLHRLLEHLDVKDLPMEVTLAGRIKAKGQVLHDLRFRLQPELAVADLAIIGAPWRRKPAPPYPVVIKAARLSADTELTPRGITMHRGRITIDESALVIDGARFMFDAREGMYLKATSERFSLGSVSPVAGLPIAGDGPIEAEVKGPYDNLEISGSVRLAGAGVMGMAPGDLRAGVKLKGDVLTVTDLAGRKGKFSYQGGATVDFRKGLSIAADFASADAPLQDIFAVLNLKGVDLSGFGGTVGVKARVEGPPSAITGNAALTVTDARVFTQKIDRIDAAVSAKEGAVTIDKFAVLAAGAKVTAEGTISPRGYLNLSVRTENLRVSQIPGAAVKKYPFDALVDLKASVGGTTADPAVEARVNLNEITVGSQKLPPSYADVVLKEKKVEADLNLFGGALLSKFKAHLAGRQPFSLGAEIKEFPYPLVVPGGESLKGKISAEINLSGNLAEAAKAAGEMKLTALDFEASDMKFALKKSTTVAVRGGGITMDPIVIGGEGIEVTISSGQVSAGEVNVTAEGTADLSVLEMLAKDTLTAEGALLFKVNVAGKPDALELSGEASLDDGTIQIEDFPHPLEKIGLRVSLGTQKIRVEELKVEVADGTVEGSGEVDLDAFVPQKYRFSADMRGVNLKFPRQFPSKLSGRVTVDGDMSSMLVGGDVNVESARYTENLDWKQVLLEVRRKRTKVASFDKEKEFVKFDLGVKADSNIVVKNNLVDAELKADLRLTGSTQRVGVIGTVSTVRGRARILSHDYEVKRAQVQLRERYRIAYGVDVQVDTTCHDKNSGADHPIRLLISGDENDVKVTPTDSFSPPYSETDIMSCLALGVTAAEVGKAGGTDATDIVGQAIGIQDVVRGVAPIEIETFRITQKYSETTKTTIPMVMVGWKLTSDVRLQYSTSVVDSSDQKIDVDYRLNRVATLRGQWGSNAQVPVGNLGVDLKLRWEY